MIVCLFTYWVQSGVCLRRMTVVVEESLRKSVCRIVGKIRWSDLASIENIGRRANLQCPSRHTR